MRLVLIGAHPDDETLSMGATLSQYAARGVEAYYLCATRGEANAVNLNCGPDCVDVGDARWAELQLAARALGLAGVMHLGYHDSGLAGLNRISDPLILTAVPVDSVAVKIVDVLKDLKPEVVITCDPAGGYRHPDHIAVHTAAVRAFNLARDPSIFNDPGAYYPQKLYFTVFPRRLLRWAVRIITILGKDAHHMGANREVDLEDLSRIQFPVNAVVKLSKHALSSREKAIECYSSQIGNMPSATGFSQRIKYEVMACYAGEVGGAPRYYGQLPKLIKILDNRDYFMRAFPVPDSHHIEKDLFEDVVSTGQPA